MRAAISKAEIESTMATRFGDAFKHHETKRAEVIASGLPEIDTLVGGGLPRGAITEIFGPASSGRTSFMLATFATATNHEEVCALVDMNNTLDPESASGANVNFERLLWIRCDNNLEHAFKATDLLLQGGGFGIVMLDLADLSAKAARRIISSWWFRFRRVLENTPTALLVITQDCSVRSCAALSLEMKNEAVVWSQVNQDVTKKKNSSLVDLSTRVKTTAPFLVTQGMLLRSLTMLVERHRPLSPTTRETKLHASAQ
jgi:recA bacterial DNA recombination protein